MHPMRGGVTVIDMTPEAYVAFMLGTGQPAPVAPPPDDDEPQLVDYQPDDFSQWRHMHGTYEEHPADPDLTAVTLGEDRKYQARCRACRKPLHEFRP